MPNKNNITRESRIYIRYKLAVEVERTLEMVGYPKL